MCAPAGVSCNRRWCRRLASSVCALPLPCPLSIHLLVHMTVLAAALVQSALYGWYKSLCCASDDCTTLLFVFLCWLRSAWLQCFGLTVWLHWFRFNYTGSEQFWDLTANVCLLVVYIGGKFELALFLPRLHSFCAASVFVN